MQELLLKIPDIIQVIALIIMCLVLLATAIVRMTPSKVDDEKLSAFAAGFIKILNWMPTIGLNPKTKELQKAYEALVAGSTITTTSVEAVKITETEVTPDESSKPTT